MAIFDREASTYDDWYRTKLGAFIDKVETDLAFDLFPAKPGMMVLDVGCGTGNFSIKLAKKGCKVVGIDISEEMLDIAREKVRQQGLNIRFYQMDVYDLQFPDEHFDAIFSMAAFEFVRQPEKALEEMFRVAKQGAPVLVSTINRDSRWGELYLSEEFQKNTVFKYADFKTLEDLKRLKSSNLVKTGECLFIPPDIDERDIGMEKEKKLAASERGGFICALWQK